MAKKDSKKMLLEKIEALEGARKRIKCGTNNYICMALMRASPTDRARDALCTYISKAILPFGFFDTWLARNKNRRDAKECRLQWIDWMIACLQEDLAQKGGSKK